MLCWSFSGFVDDAEAIRWLVAYERNVKWIDEVEFE